jgi:hypothetical protein
VNITKHNETCEMAFGKPEIKIQKQGKCVIQSDFPTFLVMTPDGHISGAPSRKSAEKICRDFFRRTISAGCAGVGEIEWR